MSLLGSIPAIAPGMLQRVDAPLPKIALPSVSAPGASPLQGFGQLLDHVVASVDTKQQNAAALTRQVLTGESDQLHQSIIAMQEAGVAFSMMVEVRNKLVESYQELMRMQA
jgi:flagellar hook-basal body complex protein FliE